MAWLIMLIFNIVYWFNSVSIKCKNKLSRTVNQAKKIKGNVHLSELYTRQVERKDFHTDMDPLHPFHDFFFFQLPSGKWFEAPLVKKSLYKKLFIPTAQCLSKIIIIIIIIFVAFYECLFLCKPLSKKKFYPCRSPFFHQNFLSDQYSLILTYEMQFKIILAYHTSKHVNFPKTFNVSTQKTLLVLDIYLKL